MISVKQQGIFAKFYPTLNKNELEKVHGQMQNLINVHLHTKAIFITFKYYLICKKFLSMKVELSLNHSMVLLEV